MLERHAIEIELPQIFERQRIQRLGLLRNVQDALEHIQRRFGLAIDVDDVAKLLQRAEDEERVDPQREELADGDRADINQVEHQKQDAGPQEIHDRALNEAEAPEVLHLFQLEPQDLAGRGVQPLDFLLAQPEALHQLDISQRLGRRSGQGGRGSGRHRRRR